MSNKNALILRVRVAIERAERHWITESIVANARTAVVELIDARGSMPATVKFIEECWQVIEEFLNSRNVNLSLVSISGVEERVVSAAWSAFEDLEIAIRPRGRSH